MKPMLRTIKNTDRKQPFATVTKTVGNGGYSLPPEMQNRPDAAELRAFIKNFRKIGNADDRRSVMDAVCAAADSEH